MRKKLVSRCFKSEQLKHQLFLRTTADQNDHLITSIADNEILWLTNGMILYAI